MYLYETKRGTIHVYSLTPKKDEIKRYKMQQMTRIHEGIRVCEGIEEVEPGSERVLVVKPNSDENYVTRAQMNNISINPCSMSKINSVLNEYYKGGFVNPDNPFSTLKVEMNNGYTYFIMGWPYEKDTAKSSPHTCIADKMIRVTKKAYLLNALEQGKFKLVQGEDIKEQLRLFTLKQEYEIDVHGLLECDYQSFNTRMYKHLRLDYDVDQEILTKARGFKIQ